MLITEPFAHEVTDFRLDGGRLQKCDGEQAVELAGSWKSEAELQDLVEAHIGDLVPMLGECFSVSDGRGAGGADILAIDSTGTLLVVEVKKGTVSSNVVGQLYRYLAMLGGVRSVAELLAGLPAPHGEGSADVLARRAAATEALGPDVLRMKPRLVGVAVARNVTGSARRLIRDLALLPTDRKVASEIQGWGLSSDGLGRYRLLRYRPALLPGLGQEFREGDVITDDEWFHTRSERSYLVRRRPSDHLVSVPGDDLVAVPSDRLGNPVRGKHVLLKELVERWRFIRLASYQG